MPPQEPTTLSLPPCRRNGRLEHPWKRWIAERAGVHTRWVLVGCQYPVCSLDVDTG